MFQKKKRKTDTSAHHLFNLFRLELDSLAIDENTLALVRLGASPFTDLGSELRHLALVDALEENAGRLGCAGLDTLGNAQLNGVGEADLQGDELLAGIRGSDGGGLGLDGSPVTDTDHTEDTDMTFRDADDVVLEKCARCAWTIESLC